MKNSNDTIGNRTRDLPACNAMPQPTAPPRTPMQDSIVVNIKKIDLYLSENEKVATLNFTIETAMIEYLYLSVLHNLLTRHVKEFQMIIRFVNINL